MDHPFEILSQSRTKVLHQGEIAKMTLRHLGKLAQSKKKERSSVVIGVPTDLGMCEGPILLPGIGYVSPAVI
jgi:hypothetical protein